MYFCCPPDHHTFGNTVLHIGVPRFTNADDLAIFNTNITFYNTPMINDDDIGDTEIQHLFITHGTCRLSHTITNGFSTTKFIFFTIDPKVFFNFNKKLGIC
ncbi:hypothetical protein D3C81_1703120 [compost metagenome]